MYLTVPKQWKTEKKGTYELALTEKTKENKLNATNFRIYLRRVSTSEQRTTC